MNKLIIIIIILNIKLIADNIKYTTSAYDTFTGWDFYSNKKISIGIINDLKFPIYQHKIHDNIGKFFDEGEYFCDPDDIIDVTINKKHLRKYLMYAQMKRDVFLNNKRDFFRVTYLYNDIYKEFFDLKISKTLVPNTNYIKSNIYFINKSKETINFSFIAQDAAYMNLKDQSQKNVLPFSKINGKIIKKFTFQKLHQNDEVGTIHKISKLYGAFKVHHIDKHCRCYGGVTMDYLFFHSHHKNNQFPFNILGYADLSSTENKSVSNIIDQYIHNMPKRNLKNRVILFQCKNIKPNEKIVIEYKQIGDIIK